MEKTPKELIGYIPWMFNIPVEGREHVFDYLTDENCFFSEFGLTTADKSSNRFLYVVNHECLWNGYRIKSRSCLMSAGGIKLPLTKSC
jgi:hypothetical protein